jgi:hypothetical protein
MRRIIITILLLAFLPHVASAAQTKAVLEVMTGEIFVNQGQGLEAVSSKAVVESNAQIILKAGSAALLVSEDGTCVFSLREEGVYKVPALHDCKLGQAAVLASGIMVSPANGVYTTALPAGEAGLPGSAMYAGLGFATTVAVIATYSVAFGEKPVSGY